MAALLEAFLNIVVTIFYLLAALGVGIVLLGSIALFIILAAGFGKKFLVEHEQSVQEE